MDGLTWIDMTVRIPAKPLLDKREVCLYLDVGKEALDDLMMSGQFPRPIQVSPKTLRWRAEWIRWFLDRQELLPRLFADEGFSKVLEGFEQDTKVLDGKRRSGKVGD